MDAENRSELYDEFLVGGRMARNTLADPVEVAAPLFDLPEFQDIVAGGAVIDWLLRREPKMKGGRQVLGTAYMPSVQGELRQLFDWMLERLLGRTPDFLIILDLAYWSEASTLEREILCFHELKHCQIARDLFGSPKFHKNGQPIWALAAHEIEEFHDTVRRYGAHSDELGRFLAAVREHEG